ncbi:MAG: hypothetical protein JRE40_07680 [Deltaproteobacteria bacterium]|nr:hypothetical protein [Deltaproteobacteria bacterium]
MAEIENIKELLQALSEIMKGMIREGVQRIDIKQNGNSINIRQVDRPSETVVRLNMFERGERPLSDTGWDATLQVTYRREKMKVYV